MQVLRTSNMYRKSQYKDLQLLRWPACCILSVMHSGACGNSGSTMAVPSAAPGSTKEGLPLLAFYVHISDKLQLYMLKDVRKTLVYCLNLLRPILCRVLHDKDGAVAQDWQYIHQSVLRPLASDAAAAHPSRERK